jgi:histidinol-phosphate aminotransferase
MQTLSKAWGLAALRLGLCFASMDIIDIFNKVKPPYNINEASQQIALDALQETAMVNKWIKESVHQKEEMANALVKFSFVKKVYPTDANFILVKVNNADALYQYLSDNEIVVRNRTKEVFCENCLRITIGTPDENNNLLSTLKKYRP